MVRLLTHPERMLTAEDFSYKDELLEKIVDICSSNKYKNITDFEWYLAVLSDLTSVRETPFPFLLYLRQKIASPES